MTTASAPVAHASAGISGCGERATAKSSTSAAVPSTTGTALRTERSGARRGAGLQAAATSSHVPTSHPVSAAPPWTWCPDDRRRERAGVADRHRHEAGEAHGPEVQTPAAVGDARGDEAHEEHVAERIEEHDDVEAVPQGVLDRGEEDERDDRLRDERAGHAVQGGAERQSARAVGEHERNAEDAEREGRGAEGDAEDVRDVEADLGPAGQGVAGHPDRERGAEREPAPARGRAQHATREHEPGAREQEGGQRDLEADVGERPGAQQRDEGERGARPDEDDAQRPCEPDGHLLRWSAHPRAA